MVGCGKDNNNLEPVDAAISKTTDSLENEHTADIRKDTEDKTVPNELKDAETADKMLNDSLNKDDDVTDMFFRVVFSSTDTLIQGCGSTVIPGSVKAIGDDAFRQLASMETIAIPDSVESIGRHAFANCISADPITIPSGVKTIETGAFNMVPHIIYSGTATYREGDEFWGAKKMN